jgi:hypothetical protein
MTYRRGDVIGLAGLTSTVAWDSGGTKLLEQLDPLAVQLGSQTRVAGQIAARAREARDQPRPHRIVEGVAVGPISP